MNKEKSTSHKTIGMVIISILGTLAIIIGISYAWFTLTLTGTKTQVLKTGTLKLTLDESASEGIMLNAAVPIKDADGLNTTAYTFTLKNTGTMDADYTLSLVDQSITGTRMPDSVVKYYFVKDGKSVGPDFLSNVTDRVLDTGVLAPEEEVSYELKLWIDYDAGNEIQGTKFNAKISVEGVQVLPNENILAMYAYEETNAATKCITGEEATCQETTEYEPGTIVKYKVNAIETKYFYILHDDGDTLTMQQREDTTTSTWNSSRDITQGPIEAITALEAETADWDNVLDQTYTMGTTVFGNADNAFTGCSSYDSCTTNIYTWAERTAKVRMITLQEAASTGCTRSDKSCPIWMYNYLSNSTGNGGTENAGSWGYWIMSGYVFAGYSGWFVNSNGYVLNYDSSPATIGVRAVVVIDK